MIPSLDISLDKVDAGSALVNISASCRLNLTGRTLRNPSTILSRTKWQSISICFVLSWNVGLEAIAVVAWLSHNTVVGIKTFTWRSVISCVIHITDAKALYSASAEDRETVACFLDFQEIMESPMKMHNPVIDLLVSRHDPPWSPINIHKGL